MAEYNSIISAYSSFFELSVAFNFAYAASKGLRDTIKSGFLRGVRNLSEDMKNTIKGIYARIEVLEEDDTVTKDVKEKALEKLTKISKQIDTEDDNLDSKIDNKQSIVAEQVKPIYVVTAMFSLYMIFLGGQESYHLRFPYYEVSANIFVTFFIVVFLFVFSFFKKYFSTVSVVFLSLLFFCLTILFPNFIEIGHLENYFIPKYLVDIALILAFMPFVVSATRLFLSNIFLYLPYRWKMFWWEREIGEIYNRLDGYNRYKNKVKELEF